MREFGKVSAHFWIDSDMETLSDNGKLLALYLLTTHHGNLLGIFRMPLGYIATDLKWDLEKTAQTFDELETKRFAKRSSNGDLIVIHNYTKHNRTENNRQLDARLRLLLTMPSNLDDLLPEAANVIDGIVRKATEYEGSSETSQLLEQIHTRYLHREVNVRLEKREERIEKREDKRLYKTYVRSDDRTNERNEPSDDSSSQSSDPPTVPPFSASTVKSPDATAGGAPTLLPVESSSQMATEPSNGWLTESSNGSSVEPSNGWSTESSNRSSMEPSNGSSVESSNQSSAKSSTNSTDPKTKAYDAYPDDFIEWWSQYPKREGDKGHKKQTFGKYKKRLKEGHTAESLLANLLNYAHYCDDTSATGTQFVKTTVVYLNNPDNLSNPWTVNYAARERANRRPEPLDQFLEANAEHYRPETGGGGYYPEADSRPVWDHDRPVRREMGSEPWSSGSNWPVVGNPERSPPEPAGDRHPPGTAGGKGVASLGSGVSEAVPAVTGGARLANAGNSLAGSE